MNIQVRIFHYWIAIHFSFKYDFISPRVPIQISYQSVNMCIYIILVLYPPFFLVQRHENRYFLEEKVGTSNSIIVLGQESGYFFIKELL